MKCDQVYGLLLAAATGFVGLNVQAEDWPHWRGPQRDGTTKSALNPAFAGANGQVKVKWSADIGVGFTGVTVAAGKAYTAGWNDGNTTFYCFDADTGEKKWSHTFPTQKYDNLNVGGPSGSAAVDGEHVYHMARDGKLFCYKTDTGKIAWEKDLTEDYGVKIPQWGFSGSPVILGQTLYIDIGKIVALSKADGKEVWKTADLGPAYSTPAPFTFKGKDYLAVFPSSGLHVLDRSSGATIASQPWKTDYGVHAATPVIIEDHIFISSEYNNGCAMLKFDGKSLSILWENRNLRNKMGTTLYVDGHLYGFESTKFVCVNAKTGEQLWNERGLGHGTVIAAGDTLIVLSDKGEVITAPVSPEGFKPISRAKLIDGDSTVWTSPTLANGKLYVRGSRGKLVCVDVNP